VKPSHEWLRFLRTGAEREHGAYRQDVLNRAAEEYSRKIPKATRRAGEIRMYKRRHPQFSRLDAAHR